MRRVLLWMAANPWLRERLPRLWFARRAVRRFLPGEDAAAALDAGERFRRDGIATLYTRLGENLTRIDEADEVAEHYLGVFDELERRGLDGEVSVKLTQLGFDLDPDRTYAHAARLASRAASLGNDLLIDPIEPQGSYMTLPTGPGLGIEFNEAALEKVVQSRRRVAA